jgi:hypothetical protein
MAAECWGCLTGVASVGTDPHQGIPLGSCWECGVFGCPVHAERDSVSGKWVCFSSVARAVSASARIDAVTLAVEPLLVLNPDEFVERFRRLADATAEERLQLSAPNFQARIAELRPVLWEPDSPIDAELALIALAIGHYLVKPMLQERYDRNLLLSVVTGDLGRIVSEFFY